MLSKEESVNVVVLVVLPMKEENPVVIEVGEVEVNRILIISTLV